MNNTIIMPKKIGKLVPKPTKKQILEALVHKAKIRHELNEKKKLIKFKKIDSKIKEIAIKEFLKDQTIADVSINYRGDINLYINEDKLKLGSLIEERKKNSNSYFYESDVKKEFMKKLENPNPLIGNKIADVYLESLLDSIISKKEEALECNVEVCIN
jgi:Flp pilus assembly CpaF family ATPase